MNTLPHLLLIVLAVLVLSPTLQAGSYQPRMQAAIEFLEEAKSAAEPIPLLEKARNELEHAKKNKGGRLPDAFKAIDEAIELARKGLDPSSKIQHAIAMVRSGMNRGEH